MGRLHVFEDNYNETEEFIPIDGISHITDYDFLMLNSAWDGGLSATSVSFSATILCVYLKNMLLRFTWSAVISIRSCVYVFMHLVT